jgi:hypothetical protein
MMRGSSHDANIAYGDPCPYCGEPDDTHHPGVECDPEPEPDEDKLIAWKQRMWK